VHPGDLKAPMLKGQLLSEIVRFKKRRNPLTYKGLLDLYAETD
jgi:hypothetical protein